MGKFGKFNISDKSATPKGKVPATRLLSKDHSIYSTFFDEEGRLRSEDLVKQILENMDVVNRQKTETIFFGKKKFNSPGEKHGQ